MTCGHLFNGIGGFALTASWMGWENAMHCEIDSFCNKVMSHHFPNSYQHEDIRTTDFTIWRGKLDLITGGFPLGKRKGKEDDRHLWPEMLRAIREIQPTWIVGENVRGLTNWNGGLVFDEVQTDMETEGYEVLPFLLPAAGVNAPHRRDRIWFVAHANRGGFGRHNRVGKNRCQEKADEGEEQREERDEVQWQWVRFIAGGNDAERVVANATHRRLSIGNDKQNRRDAQSISERYDVIDQWQDFPTQSPICGRNDGLPSGLADITFPKWRKESIKAMGNAVVPQVVFQIFKAIDAYACQTS